MILVQHGPPRWLRDVLTLQQFAWFAYAELNCFQGIYTPDCCLREGARTLPFTHESCAAYAPIQNTPYLRPDKMSASHASFYQHAFLLQGEFNTNTYADCRSSWLGVTVRQPAQDLMIFQQLIYQVRPLLVIETGTHRGGLAFFISTLYHLMGVHDAKIVTIDLKAKEAYESESCGVFDKSQLPAGGLGSHHLWQRYVHEIVADSVDNSTFHAVQKHWKSLPVGSPVMITLDSDHSYDHVWREICRYAPLVTVNSYLVVQDIILSFARYPWKGPWHAMTRLLHATPYLKRVLGTYIWDRSVEAFGYTAHAYLRRVA